MFSGLQTAQRIIEEDIEKVIAQVGDKLERLSGKTLLISGAGGFLPAYLVYTVIHLNDRYLSKPCRLVILIRHPLTEETRLRHLLGRKDVQVLQQDVSYPLQFYGPLDFIVHAASRASPKFYRMDPIETMDANTVGLRNLLEIARTQRVESFLFFSSGEIYGDPDPQHVPTPETYGGNVSCISPRSCYTESKRYGETLCVNFHREYGVPVKCVRIFHVYGPGQRLDDGRVIPDFIANGLRGEPITIRSDGKATRTFCYISDATAAFWQVLLSNKDGEVFNVGNDRVEISIKDLAEMVCQAFDHKISVEIRNQEIVDYMQDTPARSCPDLTKIRQTFGYEPKVDMVEGLRRTVLWYQAQHSQGCAGP